jgi:heptosyltransferase-2
MKAGILKPDHLGDLVLAAPAIAALRRHIGDPVLLCHPRAIPLAAHLFPGLNCEPIAFAHLDKDRKLPLDHNPLLELGQRFDVLISLRWDGRMAKLFTEAGIDCCASGEENFGTHVTVEQRSVVAPFTGPYDLLTSYSYEASSSLESPRSVRRIGLCIAAGFSLNAWPLNHWLSLAEMLDDRGFEIALIGGPAERVRLRVLADSLGRTIGRNPRCLVGTNAFGPFLQEVAGAVDLVIATDSGTAHLASLVRPVISLFGGSPWRRYAPLGRHNVVLSRLEACSPCRQFDRTSVSTCHSQECLNLLTPAEVLHCLELYLEGEPRSHRFGQGRVWMLRAPWDVDGNAPGDRVCVSTDCQLTTIATSAS